MYHLVTPGPDLHRPAEEGTPRLDLGELLLFLRRRWAYILVTALGVAALAALALLQATPRYSATSSVAVQTQKTQVVDIQDVMSGLSPDDATLATQATILRSPRLAGKLADQLHLDQDPEFNPDAAKGAHNAGLLSSLLGDDGAAPAVPPDTLRARIVGRVMAVLEINPVARSYVIEITATTTDPDKSARLANALADIYINDQIEAKYEATRQASVYLQKRVDELRDETQSADRSAELFRAQSGLAATDQGSTIANQQLSELSTQLITARADRAAKEAELAQIRSLAAGGAGTGLEASGAILQSPLIQRLREQESEVARTLAQLQATYGPLQPQVINAQAALRDIRAKIGEEVNKIAASAANDVSTARAREGALAASLARIEGTVNAGGAASVRLRELQRESDANRSIYEVFLNRLKQTDQQTGLQTADARIVSQAMVPLSASFPKTRATLLVATGVGLIAGLMLAFAMERLDNTIRSAAVLEALGGGATLAFIPTVRDKLDQPESVVTARTAAMVPEALRTLRSAIALSDVDAPPKVVMLSSSVPGEGKTFISIGLAQVSAQAGARTVLVDCDLRHPRAHKALGIGNERGLVQVLSGEVPLADALARDADTGLDVLPAGRGAINPPDLLRSEQMARLIRELRASYDFVVIDSPPFAPLTDSQILTHVVDKMLLVVRWGMTPLPVVQGTIRQAQRVKAPLVGSVLSQVDLTSHAKYGYGDYGYHYARHGQYYGGKAT